MNQRKTSIIIPAPQFNLRLPALEALGRCGLDLARYEILVAEGANPSRQRNLAIQKAQGDFLLFLDSDCQVDADYFARLEKHIESLEFDVLGGPTMLPPQSPPLQQVFQSTLAHPLIVGAAASRYAPRGSLRRSDERELILCNLAVRSEFFRQAGGFNEALYPNEENEWLDRAAKKARVYYDPDLRVRREQRETWLAFAHMLTRYGIGRTRQSLASRSFNQKQIPALLLLLWMIFVVMEPEMAAIVETVFIILFIPLVAVTQSGGSVGNRLLTGLAGLYVFCFYALGQIIGFFSALKPKNSAAEIRILNGRGEPVN